MKMYYFTEKGVNQVIDKYQKEYGKEFYFNNTDKKYKLDEITKQSTNSNDCFYIIFNSYSADPIAFATIDKFMSINNLKYNFLDFDVKAISE